MERFAIRQLQFFSGSFMWGTGGNFMVEPIKNNGELSGTSICIQRTKIRVHVLIPANKNSVDYVARLATLTLQALPRKHRQNHKTKHQSSLMMYHVSILLLLLVTFLFHGAESLSQQYPSAIKTTFLQNLDDPTGMNRATRDRTRLVSDLIQENPTPSPGSTVSFTPLAIGTWRVIYAPHIVTMASWLQGSFDPVYYIMKPNGEMTSHVQYQFPLIGSGWLSVSGTYSSQDEDKVCRVDFNQTWLTLKEDEPLPSLEMVPNTLWKVVIQALGKLFFIDAVSVFPVSYLDKDTIVFDFELLGTRICARKVEQVKW